MAQKVPHVLHGKQVLASSDGSGVDLHNLGVQRIVQRIDRLLEPRQVIARQRLRAGQRIDPVEAAVGIHGEALTRPQHTQHGLNPSQVLRERCAPDLHLHHRVAQVEVGAHLLGQRLQVLAGVVVATRGVHEHGAVDAAVAVPVGEELEQREPRELGGGIPHRHVQRTYRDRPLPSPPGFSLRIAEAQTRPGSRSPLSSSNDSGSASNTRGMKRSRSIAPWP